MSGRKQLNMESAQFSPHLGEITLLNYTEPLQPNRKTTGEKSPKVQSHGDGADNGIPKRPHPDVNSFPCLPEDPKEKGERRQGIALCVESGCLQLWSFASLEDKN